MFARVRTGHTEDMGRVLAVLATIAIAAAGSAAQAAGPTRAALKLTRSAPATVHGSGFHGHERVRLILRRSIRDIELRSVTAGAAGTFTATFRQIDLGPCSGFTLTAIGNAGSRAGMHRMMPLHAC